MTQPQQPSVEELKECREAFEKAAHREGYTNFHQNAGHYTNLATLRAWRIWEACWNRRTSPSPAEVSSERYRGAFKAENPTEPVSCANMIHTPARVEGEHCPTCGETEPHTGTCGTSDSDTKALCKRALSTTNEKDGHDY